MTWRWQNGALLPDNDGGIDPADRGLLLGDGLFETMRATRAQVPLLGRHLARLIASAALLEIPVPYAAEVLDRSIRELLGRLSMTDAAVRLTLTRGPGPRGLALPDMPRPMVMIRAAARTTAILPPARGIFSEIARNDRSPISRMKTLNCLDQVLALRAARQAGCDEAIMLNNSGHLACATTANIFVVRHGIVSTPDIGSGVLPGITRGRLIEAWPEVVVQPLKATDLSMADEAFLTNSLMGVRPLVHIDGRPIGTGVAGPITAQATKLLEHEFAP